MKQFDTIDDNLLVKYLVSETDDEETLKVESWIQASEENKKYFEQFVLIWEQSLQLSTPANREVEDAWLHMQQRIQQHSKIKTATPVKILNKGWWRIAAAVVMVIGISWLSYVFIAKNNTQQVASVMVSSADKVITDTLPDGSVITVNKNSTLSYPSKFSGNTRAVALNGEAFFNITPDKTKPFIIHVNDVTVRVVGTSFNIKSEGGKTEVIVETGIVQVTKKNRTVQLLPKQKIVTQWKDSALAKDTVQDELYNYYRSKEFICNNTPLQSLVQTLNEAYNVHIIIEKEALKDLPITTVFKDESLDNILVVISETLNIKIEKTGNEIILH